MRRCPLPSIDVLRAAISIDPRTGLMTWRRRPASHFRSEASAASWNTQFSGTPAFSTLIRGYLHGIINSKRYRAHRIAFALYTGHDPDCEIDHIDGDKTNNAALNLRAVTSAENKRNLAIPAHNRSGVIGVCFSRSKGKWRAYIGTRPQTHIGYFDAFDDAVAARRTAQSAHGYHPNHGRAS
ncbi:hypothetical protein JI59_18555 [Novosphingobium pentaromativorans US6-1]|nr:hypothetical protein JI59_18555 [Novosphingobium pentaromativorans US6-1]